MVIRIPVNWHTVLSPGNSNEPSLRSSISNNSLLSECEALSKDCTDLRNGLVLSSEALSCHAYPIVSSAAES